MSRTRVLTCRSRALAAIALYGCIAQAVAAQGGARAPEAPRTLSGAAPSMGRLFFTPAERAQLDLARLRKPEPPKETAHAPEAPPVPQVVSYGGIVRRSDGKALLWINNRLVEEKEALAGLNLKGKVRPDGAVTVQVPEGGGSINVKVGQSVELHTGRVAETRRKPDDKTAADETQPAGEPKPAPATGTAPARPAQTEDAPPSASVGLKLDLGSRPLQPHEERQLRR